jgi:hypothetical protein
MILTPYISNILTFDLTGAEPLLVVQDNSTYPDGIAPDVKGWLDVRQPDGIQKTYGSINSPAILFAGGGLNTYTVQLRKASDLTPQRGEYTVTYHILHLGVETVLTRTFQLNYQEVKLSLEEQFNVFTPSLKYEDKTNYAVPLYSILSKSVAWSATVGTLGSVAGSAPVFDLVYALNYYDAQYHINFSSQLLYQHTSYTYLRVRDSFAQAITAEATTPPATSQLLSYLNTIKQRFVSKKGTCEPYQQYLKAYIRATALLYHIGKRICAGMTLGLDAYITEFMDIYYDYDGVVVTHTNLPIQPYDTGDCSSIGGGSIPAQVLAITASDIARWNAAYNAIPPHDLNLVAGVDTGLDPGSATYQNASMMGWNIRLYINRLRQTMRSDYQAGDLWFEKPVDSDILTLHGDVFRDHDLVQIEMYRAQEDIVFTP